MTTISPLAAAGAQAVPAPAALQAALEQLQQRLSDCINCASAATPRGKADIARIAAQIAQLRQRLEAPDPAPAPAPAAPSSPLGRVIDLYA